MLRTKVLTLVLLSGFAGCASRDALIHTPPPAKKPDTVIVLHGMIRTSVSMTRIASRLERAGYTVHNLSYPAREHTIDWIVDHLHRRLQACCLPATGRIHFVTHSMGGIVVRDYIAHHRPANLGRVVMLSPPNQGTELADELEQNVLVGMVFGPAVAELGTAPEDKPRSLGAADFEVGVITGDRSWNPVASWLIPGPDDGTVSVENAKIKGMADFLVVPHTHTFIMNSDKVVDEVLYFLEHGWFNAHPSSSERPVQE